MPLASVPSFAAASPEIFLAVAAMALLLLGAFVRERDAALATSYGGICVLIAAAALVVVLGGPSTSTFGGAFIFDNFAVFLKVLILISSAAVILIARDYLARHGIDRFEFPVLIVLASLGM